MMKFHATIAAALATYFVSGASQDGEAILALNNQLRQTEHSLSVMNQLKARKDSDPESVTALLLSATEPPVDGQAELDRRLSLLRQELSVLSMETEIILGTSGAPAHRSNPKEPDAASQPLAHPQPLLVTPTQPQAGGSLSAQGTPMLVSGLSPRVLALLSNPGADAPGSARPATLKFEQAEPVADTMSKPEPKQAKKPEIKLNGYSADPMLQAKASYRAELYENCLTILAKQKSAEAEHLRSRCLTRLNRLDEAIESLKRIIKLEPETHLGRRAQEDLDFAIWIKAANDQ